MFGRLSRRARARATSSVRRAARSTYIESLENRVLFDGTTFSNGVNPDPSGHNYFGTQNTNSPLYVDANTPNYTQDWTLTQGSLPSHSHNSGWFHLTWTVEPGASLSSGGTDYSFVWLDLNGTEIERVDPYTAGDIWLGGNQADNQGTNTWEIQSTPDIEFAITEASASHGTYDGITAATPMARGDTAGYDSQVTFSIDGKASGNTSVYFTLNSVPVVDDGHNGNTPIDYQVSGATLYNAASTGDTYVINVTKGMTSSVVSFHPIAPYLGAAEFANKDVGISVVMDPNPPNNVIAANPGFNPLGAVNAAVPLIPLWMNDHVVGELTAAQMQANLTDLTSPDQNVVNAKAQWWITVLKATPSVYDMGWCQAVADGNQGQVSAKMRYIIGQVWPARYNYDWTTHMFSPQLDPNLFVVGLDDKYFCSVTALGKVHPFWGVANGGKQEITTIQTVQGWAIPGFQVSPANVTASAKFQLGIDCYHWGPDPDTGVPGWQWLFHVDEQFAMSASNQPVNDVQ